MNISEMKAGCELDARVAEKVMEWTLSQPEYVMGYLAHGGSMMRLYKGPGLPRKNRTTPSEEWSPSTDIAPAWEVVEKMAAAGFDWDLASDEVTFQRGNYDKPNYICATVVPKPYGENIPEAICLAALKAVENK